VIVFVQNVVLPIAGLALLWMARRWVVKRFQEMPPPPKRRQLHDTEPSGREKFRRDWGL